MKRKAILIILGLVLGTAEMWLGWSLLAQNFLGAYLIFIGLGYCIGGAFFLAFGAQGTLPQSDRSLLGFMPGGLLILLVMPLEYHFLPEVLSRDAGIQWLGLGIILPGMALRLWTRRSLKKAYQGNLQVQANQQLVVTGPYRWVRHPGYLAFGLQALGLSLGFSSLTGLLGLVLLTAGLGYRIHIEERMLMDAFGKDYQAYASRTHRLIPGIW